MKRQNGKAELTAKQFSARAVRMYQAGSKVSEIAQKLGYAKGHGQNRVANTLIRAGVYQGKRAVKQPAA